MVRKFIPRIHLITALMITVAAGVLLGLNLRERREAFVLNRLPVLDGGEFSRRDLYMCFPNETHCRAGWPLDAYGSNILPDGREPPDATPLLKPEREELNRLDLSMKEWTTDEFAKMAPTIANDIYEPYETILNRRSFIDFSSDWFHKQLAINISIAMAILIALAAASEMLIRRRARPK